MNSSVFGAESSPIAAASERAYRYLEASRALNDTGPGAASALLAGDSRPLDVLWLSLLAPVQAYSDGTAAAEIFAFGASLLCWLAVLLVVSSLAGNAWGEVWGGICGGFLLASGAFLWGSAGGDDLGLLALLFVLMLWSIQGGVPRRRFTIWIALIAPLAGPAGIGLAVGCVLTFWTLSSSRLEAIRVTAATLCGCAVYSSILAVLDPMPQDGAAFGIGGQLASVFGGIVRGGWSVRMDASWRLVAGLGSADSLLGWMPGLAIAFGLAAWIVPVNGDDAGKSDGARNIGTGLTFMIPSIVFAAAAVNSPVREIYPVALPGIVLALTGAAHDLWLRTRRLGVVPVSGFVALLAAAQLMSYADWALDAKENALRQGRIVAAYEEELAVEPARRVVVGDVPAVRWRLGGTGRILMPDEAGGLEAPVLMPRAGVWSERISPLAPVTADLQGMTETTIGTAMPLVRWTQDRESAKKSPEGIIDLEPVWLPSMGLDGLAMDGIPAHLIPWWDFTGMRESLHAPSQTHLLTTETDGAGREYSSVLSDEFMLSGDMLLLRVGCTKPSSDCSLRLLVWQSTAEPMAQEAPVEKPWRHIDLTEPGAPLQAELFAYDDPESLVYHAGGHAEAWRVVKIVRGNDLRPGLNEIFWTAAPWKGQRARWSLSDRTHEAAIVVDSIQMGRSPAVRSWDFESGGYDGWTVIGEAFGVHPVDRPYPDQQSIAGTVDGYFANSYLDGSDAPRGWLESWPFPVEGDVLSFRLGGGNDPGRLGVELVIEGHTVASATGKDAESLDLLAWDVSPYRDRQAVLRILDLSSAPWGHVLVDSIHLWPREDAPADAIEALTATGQAANLSRS